MRVSLRSRIERSRWATFLVIATLTVCLAAWSERPAKAVVPGVNGKIAFVSNRDGNYEIYVMNADGSGQTRLTNNPARDLEPAWSPDGTKIAFSSDFEIFVMNADGSGQTRLTNNGVQGYLPAWSPDGAKIAFTSVNREVYVMNADGSDPTNLTNNPSIDEQPAWSPDGTKIAFVSARDDSFEVYVMNADGSDPTNLTKNSAEDYEPAWSPNGTKITFTSERDIGDEEIYVMNADGTGQTRLTDNEAFDYNSAWSPDGTKIAYTSYQSSVANGEVYVMNADGSDPTNLTKNSADNFDPDWRPLTPAELIEDVSELVESYNLPHGIENALRVKLDDALAAISGGDAAAARGRLRSFLNQVEAQRGKKLTAEQADALVEAAEAILATLE